MENTKPYPVVVPYDFTHLSDVAIDHAVQIARLCNYPITLLNIIDKSTQHYIREHNLNKIHLDSKLNSLCEEHTKKHNIPFNYIIKKGSILSIRKMAAKLQASYMVIGIEKPKSSVSAILRMIGKSPVPVYIIQDHISCKPFKSIIFPIDGFKETRQKTLCAIRLAKGSGAQINLFSIKKNNEGRQDRQNAIIGQIKRTLSEYAVPFTFSFARGSRKAFADELLDFAKKAKGDLFVLMKTPRIYFTNTIFYKVDKKVLLNTENTPVVYINSNDIGRYR